MAGETIKTRAVVLDIRPWSRTSHVVTWLTPEAGIVATPVKGAVRPKSAFLGQYDFFYTCELVYYARARGELHAIRETTPLVFREGLRRNWRAAAWASYAAQLVKEHCPHNSEAAEWMLFFERSLDSVAAERPESAGGDRGLMRALAGFELGFLRLAGLTPDFSQADFSASEVPFSIDSGCAGEGVRTVRLPVSAALFLAGRAEPATVEDFMAAVRFLGLFMRYHLGTAPEMRRMVLEMLGMGTRETPENSAGK